MAKQLTTGQVTQRIEQVAQRPTLYCAVCFHTDGNHKTNKYYPGTKLCVYCDCCAEDTEQFMPFDKVVIPLLHRVNEHLKGIQQVTLQSMEQANESWPGRWEIQEELAPTKRFVNVIEFMLGTEYTVDHGFGYPPVYQPGVLPNQDADWDAEPEDIDEEEDEEVEF